MRTKLGTFRYQIEIADAKGDRFEAVNPWVDTGAFYSQFPASLLERLGHRPNAVRQFRLADGSIMERPIGSVPIRIGDDATPPPAIDLSVAALQRAYGNIAVHTTVGTNVQN